MAVSGRIQVADDMVDGAVEAIEVGEGLMREVARFRSSPRSAAAESTALAQRKHG
jgi:hypothetical protein